MATLPQFKLQQLARRSGGGIDRLASQYKSSVAALTDEYQKAFSSYRAGVEQQMAPFQEALAKYQATDVPAYEAAKADYQKQLEAYGQALKDLEADPVIQRTGTVQWKEPRYGLFGLAGYKTKSQEVTYYEPKQVPKFEAKMPELPGAPQAPEIAAFNQEQFQQKRQQLSSELNRELGERRAAKLGAVSRRSSRSMLQGA